MAITFFDSGTNPADNGAQAGPGPLAVTPPAGVQTGDLVLLFGLYRGSTATWSVGEASGQSWTGVSEWASGVTDGVMYWCRFNGTWGADPSLQINAGTAAMSVVMLVFRPTASSNTWSVDVARDADSYAAPSTPFTVTRAGQVTVGDSTVTVAQFSSQDNNTWDSLSGAGWANVGTAQYRNSTGVGQSLTFAAFISSVAATNTGSVSKNQATLGGDAGWTMIITFLETTGVAQATRKSRLALLGVA